MTVPVITLVHPVKIHIICNQIFAIHIPAIA
jgi:hypothetical protein